ncbi:hypothetical protein [Streptomyces sp. CAU 1734]|uniref:hypothetical protein n=1 Tax=Streptomyces sp. CAU 1734 TaxID=3140360 RepID=UPI0032600631
MTTTADLLDLPARRRRHARFIAALTTMIGACASSAGDVYGPISQADSGQDAVPVSLLQCVQLSLSAQLLLDLAVEEDAARWPEDVRPARAVPRRTFAERCAEFGPQRAVKGGAPVPRSVGAVPAHRVPSEGRALFEVGTLVCERWTDDPQQAIARVEEAVATGAFTAGEILDEAADCAVTVGLLTLDGARGQSDPSMAAEHCLLAVRHFAVAVALASADLDIDIPHHRTRARETGLRDARSG